MCKPNLAPCKPNSAICKLFSSICKPSNLCDSKEFFKFLNTNTLFWCVLYVPIIPGSICWGHFFECKPIFFGLHWFTLVYTGLPPDDVSAKTFQGIQTNTDNTYTYIQYIQYIQYMRIQADTHHTHNTNNTYIYIQYRHIHAIHTIQTYSYNTLKYMHIHTSVCMYMYVIVFACIACIA